MRRDEWLATRDLLLCSCYIRGTWLRISNIYINHWHRWQPIPIWPCGMLCAVVREEQTQSINVIHTLQSTMRQQHEHRSSDNFRSFFSRFRFVFSLLFRSVHAMHDALNFLGLRFTYSSANENHYPCPCDARLFECCAPIKLYQPVCVRASVCECSAECTGPSRLCMIVNYYVM